MPNVAERGSRALEATADLTDLLRLAHEALHRLRDEVHGDVVEQADGLSRRIRTLRQEADRLQDRIEHLVRSETATPIRR
ncbi:MAG TPA: hypothetical protein VKA14_07220 [Gammaproteobacteria bacterium]|nr:hypothetical protein [Gammaproteobacteria bacterium]